MAEDELKNVKAMLRSVLLSTKEGVPASRLMYDYRDVTGEFLPFKKFGFENVSAFVASMPDVVRLQRTPVADICHAVADATTAHIQRLVSKQRSAKKKNYKGMLSARRPTRPFNNRNTGRGFPPTMNAGREHSFASNENRHFQPHYAAIKRYGPRAQMSQRPPLLPLPKSPKEEWLSSSPPSSPPGDSPLRNLHITVGSADKRTIGAGEGMLVNRNRIIMRAMSEAFSDRRGNKNQGAKFGHRFEIPPRFRRQLAASTESGASEDPVSCSSPRVGGPDYVGKLETYVRQKNLTALKFETTKDRNGMFVSSVRINNKVYGSFDMFRTSEEAEYMAAKNAYTTLESQIEMSQGSSTSSTVSDSDLQEWIKQTLDPFPNGVWGTRISHLYKENFNEDPPSDLMDKLKSWNDIIEIEVYCNRELVKLLRQKWKEYHIQEADLLLPNDTVNVYVAFALGVDNFFVQREDSCVESINTDLATDCPKVSPPDMSVLKKGTFCAAKYEEEWYRAEIKDITTESQLVQVEFVDYGNIEIVEISSIRPLPEATVKHPAQAIPCALYGLTVKPEEATVESPVPSLKIFSDLVEDSCLSAFTIAYNTDGQCEVVLSKDGASVNAYLAKRGLVATEIVEWMPEQKISEEEEEESDEMDDPGTVILPEEQYLDVLVCFCDADLAITVRIVGVEFSDKLDDFECRLEECFKKASSSSSLKAGQVCIALVDGLYQRVIINSISDKTAECYFTDHGDTEFLSVSNLRLLSPEINSTLPYQAVRCYLHGLEKVSDTVTALETLMDMAHSKVCTAEIVDRVDRLTVILFNIYEDRDVNINQAVLSAIRAKEAQTNSSTALMTPLASQPPQNGFSSEKSDSSLVHSETTNESFSRSISKASTDSWGTEEEAEALAASYLESRGDTIGDIDNRLHGMSLKPSQEASRNSDSVFTPSPSSLQEREVKHKTVSQTSPVPSSDETGSGDGVKKKLYTWGTTSPNESFKKAPLRRLPTPQEVDIPGVGEFFDVHVLWVSDPTNFWCTPYKMVLLLENMMKELNQHFNSVSETMVLEKKDLTVGTIVAGQVEGTWYRVIIKDFVGNKISVYFPDYGQFNVLELSDLQFLPEKFYALPLCAVKAKLHGIGPRNVMKPWTEAAKFKFMELAQGRDFVCLVCDKNKSTGVISVRLIDTSQADDLLVDEVLVDMKLACAYPVV